MSLRDLALPGASLALAGFALTALLTAGGDGAPEAPAPPATQAVITESQVVSGPGTSGTPTPVGNVADLPASVTAALIASGYAEIVVPGDPGAGVPASVAAVLADRGIAVTVADTVPQPPSLPRGAG